LDKALLTYLLLCLLKGRCFQSPLWGDEFLAWFPTFQLTDKILGDSQCWFGERKKTRDEPCLLFQFLPITIVVRLSSSPLHLPACHGRAFHRARHHAWHSAGGNAADKPSTTNNHAAAVLEDNTTTTTYNAAHWISPNSSEKSQNLKWWGALNCRDFDTSDIIKKTKPKYYYKKPFCPPWWQR